MRLSFAAQRRASLKQRRESLVHALAVLAIGLKVERALVAEGAVEARPVEPGRRAQVVERGGGESVLPEHVHRLGQRGLGLESARAPAPPRGGGRRARRFLYHFEQNP